MEIGKDSFGGWVDYPPEGAGGDEYVVLVNLGDRWRRQATCPAGIHGQRDCTALRDPGLVTPVFAPAMNPGPGSEYLAVVPREADDEARRSRLASMNSYFHWVFWRESIDESPHRPNN